MRNVFIPAPSTALAYHSPSLAGTDWSELQDAAYTRQMFRGGAELHPGVKGPGVRADQYLRNSENREIGDFTDIQRARLKGYRQVVRLMIEDQTSQANALYRSVVNNFDPDTVFISLARFDYLASTESENSAWDEMLSSALIMEHMEHND